MGTKRSLIFSRDHTVDEGIEDILTWNMAMLQTSDIPLAMSSRITKEAPRFSKL